MFLRAAVLGLCLLAGCSKPAQERVNPTSVAWQNSVKEYNRPSGSGLAKRPPPGAVVQAKTEEFLTDEVLYDQRSALVESVQKLVRETQSHLATSQLGELAALAIDTETLNRVSLALPAENAYAQEVDQRAQQVLNAMSAWSAVLHPRGSPKRDVAEIPAGLPIAVRSLGPVALAYPREIEAFRAFLQRNWGEFWISEGVRMIRRPGFEGDYAQASKRLLDARKKYELVLQQLEQQTRAKSL